MKVLYTKKYNNIGILITTKTNTPKDKKGRLQYAQQMEEKLITITNKKGEKHKGDMI